MCAAFVFNSAVSSWQTSFWQAENLWFVRLLALACFLTPESFHITGGIPFDTAFYYRDHKLQTIRGGPSSLQPGPREASLPSQSCPLGSSVATSLYSGDGIMLDKIAVGRGKAKTRVLSFPSLQWNIKAKILLQGRVHPPRPQNTWLSTTSATLRASSLSLNLHPPRLTSL